MTISSPPDAKHLVVEWIYDILDHKDWSVNQLARQSGVAASTLSRLINHPQLPFISTLRSLAGASGMQIPETILSAVGSTPELEAVAPRPAPEVVIVHQDQAQALSWLAHGAELAYELKGDQARHSDVIWQLLVEAVEIIDKTPDNERRWLTSGQRSGGWNMIGMSREELIEIEHIRLLSAMKPFDGATKCSPQRDDVERALGILAWMRWCNASRLPDRLAKAAIALARNGDKEMVHKIYRPNQKAKATNVDDIRTRTIGWIRTGLKKDLGIVPGDGITFKEAH